MKIRHRVPQTLAVILSIFALGLFGCRSTQVSYEDEAAVETLTVDFGSTDVQMIAQHMIDDLNSYERLPKKEGEDDRLMVLVDEVRNKTSEHIDMQNLMDSIRKGLLRGGRFRLAPRQERREALQKELEYQQSGWTNQEDAKAYGRQVNADVFLTGTLTSIEKRKRGRTIVHYKFTLELENIETGEIIWIDEKELRKKEA